ncbi:MAG TPA: peptidoglycan-binding protein LysM, partial [Candidatus Contendobacter sp.]|nr:peptidoglycan-binding protein LysM [Candidatus Contendobacter sp.]HRZ23195.1 peptidoglycan-binding protein LysM [Candidatus Contendobacter sp.]
DMTVSRRVSEPQLSIPRPESGFHYLRIRTLEADGDAGPYGPVQRIDVPPASYWPMGLVVFLTLILAL